MGPYDRYGVKWPPLQMAEQKHTVGSWGEKKTYLQGVFSPHSITGRGPPRIESPKMV